VFAEFVAWKRPRVKSTRTVEDYEAQYRAISPVLGTRPVDAITDADIQRWVDGMVAGTIGARKRGEVLVPLHPKTIANYHGLLHAVFDYAASSSRRYVASNPCTGTDLPKRRKGAVKGLRPGEWAALHAALQQVDPDAADLALALYATGARFGEVTALSTWDVEDDGRRVTVNIGHVIRREAGGLFVRVEDTKSEAGFRRVQVGSGASQVFRRRLRATRPGDLLFTNRHGRMWLPSTFRASAWLPAVELANLSRRPTPHWLRHSHIVELIDRGVPLPEIQARVGHESIDTTVNTYGRLRRGVPVSVLDDLDAIGLPQVAGPVVTGEIVG
jgi:integrase